MSKCYEDIENILADTKKLRLELEKEMGNFVLSLHKIRIIAKKNGKTQELKAALREE